MAVMIGGHAALDNIRVDRILYTYPNGVYLTQISTSNSETNQHVTKTNNDEETLMFPQTWTADRIKVEINSTYMNRVDDLDSIRKAESIWVGTSNSGVHVEGYTYPIAATFPSAEQE